MTKKVFITGGGGMLASQIESFYDKSGNDVIAPTHADLDILDYSAVRNIIISYNPDYVFHTAALHVDASEENPESAFNVNTIASENLARICAEIDATFIYISSCGYFGDEIKYYSEDDPVVLKTVYARSKYKGEALSMKACKKTFAIRPGWLFGGRLQHKKNFVYQRYIEAKKSSEIKSANDKYGCPTLVEDLVLKIDDILKTQIPGLYHVTNSGGCTRFEYVKKIIENFGLKIEVVPVDSGYYQRKADVPDCELLDNRNLKNRGLIQLPPWEDAVERYIKELLTKI